MLKKAVVLIVFVLVQGCILEPDVTEFSEEKSRSVITDKFGEIDQLTIISGKHVSTYTSDETTVKFSLSDEMAPSDWVTFLVQRYTEIHGEDQDFQSFYSVNEFQYKNDKDGKGSNIITISYYEASKSYEYNSYIYY